MHSHSHSPPSFPGAPAVPTTRSAPTAPVPTMTMTISRETLHMVLGVLGNLIALIRYLSPLPTFWRIWNKGTVEEYSAAPYVATLLNCMLYGVPAVQPHGTAIIVISATGIATQLPYVTMFLAFSSGRVRRRLVLLLFAIIVFVGLLGGLVFSLVDSHRSRAIIIGIVIVAIGTGMYASPLTVMTKSVEYMPLFLSVTLMLNSVCWTAYALVRLDIYLVITNGLGVVFSVAQLVLYAIYYKSTQQLIQVQARRAGRVVIITDTAAAGPTGEVEASTASAT